jgi:hypothetical protein
VLDNWDEQRERRREQERRGQQEDARGVVRQRAFTVSPAPRGDEDEELR